MILNTPHFNSELTVSTKKIRSQSACRAPKSAVLRNRPKTAGCMLEANSNFISTGLRMTGLAHHTSADRASNSLSKPGHGLPHAPRLPSNPRKSRITLVDTATHGSRRGDNASSRGGKGRVDAANVPSFVHLECLGVGDIFVSFDSFLIKCIRLILSL